MNNGEFEKNSLSHGDRLPPSDDKKPGEQPLCPSVAPLVGTSKIESNRSVKTDAFDKAAMVLNFFFTFFFIKGLFESKVKMCVAYLCIFVLASAYIALKKRILTVQACLSGLLCVTLSFSFAVRSNRDEIVLLVILTLIYLSGSFCLALTGANRNSRKSYFFLLDVLKTEFLIPLKHLFMPYFCMHKTRLEKKARGERKEKNAGRKYSAAIIGAVCAVPVLFVVVPLLVKGDAAFESIAGSFTSAVRRFYVGVFENSLSDFIYDNLIFIELALFAAPYIFSVMFSFRHSVADCENKDTGKKYTRLRVGSPALFAGFLGVICLVYVIYILSQGAYIFGAFGGKMPNGVEMSLSQYARRGFFELAGVAAVNLVLIAVTVLFSRRADNGDFNPVIKAADIFLCVFNALLSVVSLSKIVLYMSEMGLTHKRIYVLAVDIVMIITFLCVAARFFKKSFPYMRIITSAVCVAVAVLSLIGVDKAVAEHNTEKYLKEQLSASNVYDVTDGYSLAAFESVVKIAKSDTRLSSEAKWIIAHDYVSFDDDEEILPMHYKDGEISFTQQTALPLDATAVLESANREIETIKTCLELLSYEEHAR